MNPESNEQADICLMTGTAVLQEGLFKETDDDFCTMTGFTGDELTDKDLFFPAHAIQGSVLRRAARFLHFLV